MSDSDNKPSKVDFGRALAEARKKQNYSLEQVSEDIRIPVATLKALEASDLEKLPGSTFTQGYIRSYAKFLEISDQEILDRFNSTQPCREEDHGIKPCSKLPNEATSQSPVVKMVTGLLLFGVVAAVIFGGFNYYQEKADVMESQLEPVTSDIGSSLDSPSRRTLEISQKRSVAEDDQLMVGAESVQTTASLETDAGFTADSETVVEPEPAEVNQTLPAVENRPDVLEVDAEMGSWMEVRDANNDRLFYNMIPRHGTKTLQGKAPFKVSMGNARTTKIRVNGLSVDLKDYIRANNTANFTVSSEGQNIIFY